MGSVGIIAVLQDGGAQATHFRDYLSRYHQHPLHPLQFLELVAKVFYKASLLNRTPKYLTMESARALEVFQQPLGGFSLRPLFDDWIQEHYAHVLSFHTGAPLELIFRPPDAVMTWLNDSSGTPQRLTFEQNPWPASNGAV
jgi:hypothetical protein